MLDPHQERNDDGHEYGGRLGGPLQGETGGEGCEDGDGRGRRHPPVRVQSVNAGGVALGTRGRAQRRGRRRTPQDRAEEIQPAVHQEGGTGPQARGVRHGVAAENDGGET